MNRKSSMHGEREESRRMRRGGCLIVGEDEDCVWFKGGEIRNFEECVVCVYVLCLEGCQRDFNKNVEQMEIQIKD